MQILLRRKAAQLRIVVAHLVVHRFHQVLQGDDAENAVGGIQHGNGAFRVAFQPLDTVLRALAAVNIRESVLDKGRDSRVLFRNKQSAQLHRAAEKAVFRRHKEHLDIIVFLRLVHKRPGGLAHRHFRIQRNEIGAHSAADLVLVKRHQQLNLFPQRSVEQPDHRRPVAAGQFPQNVRRSIRVNLFQNENSSCRVDVLQEGGRLLGLDILENTGQLVRLNGADQPHPSKPVQLLHGLGNIAVMIVLQLLLDHLRRKVIPYQRRDLIRAASAFEVLVFVEHCHGITAFQLKSHRVPN